MTSPDGEAEGIVRPPPPDDQPATSDQYTGTSDGFESSRSGGRGSRWWRVLAVIAVLGAVAWTVAAFMAGVSFGTRQRAEPMPPPPDVVINVEEVAVPAVAPAADPAESSSTVANVLGLDVQTARAVLADNAPGVDVVVIDSPVAGDPGYVVAQDPLPGVANPEVVTITVTAAAPMPNVVGLTESEAVRELEALGARVLVGSRYVRGQTAGVVLDADPVDGAVPYEVKLTVAAPAGTANLTLLPPVSSGCWVTEANVDGGTFGEALRCRIPGFERDAQSVDYDLSRDVDSLTFGVGITDDSPVESRAQVTVTVDGVVVEAVTVGFGQRVDLSVTTANALRLTLSVAAVGVESATGDVAFVEATIAGSADAIDLLVGAS
jgi:hypothetical protein